MCNMRGWWWWTQKIVIKYYIRKTSKYKITLFKYIYISNNIKCFLSLDIWNCSFILLLSVSCCAVIFVLHIIDRRHFFLWMEWKGWSGLFLKKWKFYYSRGRFLISFISKVYYVDEVFIKSTFSWHVFFNTQGKYWNQLGMSEEICCCILKIVNYSL